jgi:hypothetical protein
MKIINQKQFYSGNGASQHVGSNSKESKQSSSVVC